ncbi:uncharacterized protein B0I36DRAFT_356198 [Microdochium trichocladiopsis]|uniref:Uncharacterized protein n=1 Tax=Microdochium trichocladiopsis TaxID=1682393 RepID=A0A9P8XQG6_9PEZI|nr:uncharacterized protein B0I36DRAFT_356198 [Microdochium trichocladiopsis]KAH7012100.1 hypothetical protein B0I36DRAFT_356198 [Microdochium trichocladiopsis]
MAGNRKKASCARLVGAATPWCASDFSLSSARQSLDPKAISGFPRNSQRRQRMNRRKDGQSPTELTAMSMQEQSEYKCMYVLIYLFPERAKNYSWVHPERRQFATRLSMTTFFTFASINLLNKDIDIEGMQERAQAKRQAMERGTWAGDNICMYCERYDPEMDCTSG